MPWKALREKPQHAVSLLALAAICAVLLSVIYLLLDMRQQELNQEASQTRHLSTVLSEQTAQYFDNADLVLRGIQERMQTPYGEQFQLDSLPIHLLLSTRVAGLRQVSALFLVDLKGQVINSSREHPSVVVDVSDRRYFRHFSRKPRDELFIDEPTRSRLSGQWTLYLARPILDSKRTLRGLAVAALDIPKLEKLFSLNQVDVNRTIAIYNQDKRLVASLPHLDHLIGEPATELQGLDNWPPNTQDMRTIGTVNPGSEGAQFTLAKVGNYPMYVSVRLQEDHAQALWRESAIPIFLGALMVVVFITLAAFYLVSELKFQQGLAHALDEARNRYHHTIDSVMDAIVAVDEDQAIVLFNPAAERMFGYPAHEVIGQPLSILLPERYRSTHGAHVHQFQGSNDSARPMTRTPRLDIFGRRRDGSQFPIESTISQSWMDGKIQMTAVLRDVTERREAEQRLKERNQQLRELSQSLQAVREQERAWFSQELHDDLGQQLTGLKLDLSWLYNRLKEGREASLEKVDAMRQALNHSITSVRRLASELRPVLLDDLGFGPALQWLCDDVSQRSTIPVTLMHDESLEVSDRQVGVALFRIVQEALNNVVRHAQASQASVSLRRDGDFGLMTILDNGTGLPQDQARRGIGLISMSERVHSLGGTFDIRTRPEGGTAVHIRWPLTSPDGQEEKTS